MVAEPRSRRDVGADPLVEPPPDLGPDDASEIAARVFGVKGIANRLDSERDANFRIDAGSRSFVLKVYNAAEREDVVDMQTRALMHVAATDPGLPVPRLAPTRDGALVGAIERDGRRHAVHLVDFLPGVRADPETFDLDALRAFGSTVARVGRALRGFFHPAADRALLWDMRHTGRLRPFLDDLDDAAQRALAARALARVEGSLVPALPALRAQVIHNDLTYDNVLVDRERRVTAVVDFGDTTHAPLLCDLAVALASFCTADGLFDRAEAFVRGFGEVTPIEAAEAELLADAVVARLLASALIAAARVRAFPENADYITAFGPRTWSILEVLDELGPETVRARFRLAAEPAVLARAAAHTRAPLDELLERRRIFGPAMLALTYRRPLHLVRGEGVWLFDAEGRRFLDAYNNVPAVGHCHPRVVQALTAQARLLNTNTRYLHETALALAERLVATMPSGLDVCLLVNSGSEANELAWRFATTVTGGTGALVSSWGYHGVTSVTTDLSSSEWIGGARPAYVEAIEPPGRGNDDARRAVETAARALGGRGHRAAALFLDPVHTSSGIVTDAPGWLSAAASAVRAAGGLFVADEVQAGLGRLGTYLWSFESDGVEPDVVTVGKPLGNGHPVAAVVTRSAIAEKFARHGPPVFSTFGGNPVSAAAALAVLGVIAEERLVENAASVGAHLHAGLRELGRRHRLIREVRGQGLLAGVELVDGGCADRALNGLRERGVLVGVTGRRGNVLKIRPPLVFRRDHADVLLEALDVVLGELGAAAAG